LIFNLTECYLGEKEYLKSSNKTQNQSFNEGKSIQEMADLGNRTESQIRAKLARLNLKLKDCK